MDAPLSVGEAWAIMFAKQKVPRKVVPLGFDASDHSLAAYDAVPDYLAPFEADALKAPQTRSGLRWRYEGESVLFTHDRTIAATYDALVERVDIAGGIRLMNDYIGGATHVVSRDSKGRVIRQAERNLYLPQPNWLAFSGGQYIDVCKLERIEYTETSRKISWRTVLSPNGSAVHDDGSIAFDRVDDSHTKVTVCGLQLFTLPPLWTAVDPWLTPAVKDSLVEESYRRFFTATLDNVEAAYEGRDYRIGHEPTSETPQSWDQRVEQLIELVKDALPDDPLGELAKRLRDKARPDPDLVDEHGFAHFSKSQAAKDPEPAWVAALRAWQAELAEVVKSDIPSGHAR